MLVVLRAEATPADEERLRRRIAAAGLDPLTLRGERVVLAPAGDPSLLARLELERDAAVERLAPFDTPWRLVHREARPAGTQVELGPGVRIGGQRLALIAGPCAVEGREQLLAAAQAVRAAGAHALRGGAYKARTSPYSFQGLGREGLALLAEVGAALGLPVVTEVVDPADVPAVAAVAGALQVGARNMHNYRLLAAVGAAGRPVVLKRGFAARLEELLLAAEYVVAAGNPSVALCERGIRTFEPATRNTLDLSAVPWLKARTHLPVLVDPSHATGLRELVAPMSKAAVACGADGLLIEVHPDPEAARSDGRESLAPEAFAALARELEPFARAAGRSL